MEPLWPLPTPEAADRFVNDKSPDAYEKYVERLMQTAAYGERWAHLWLDLARYADSNGYAEDQPRVIWKYVHQPMGTTTCEIIEM